MQVLVQLSNAPRRQLNFRGITVDNLLCPIGCRCQHDLHLISVLIRSHRRSYRLIHTRVQLRRRCCIRLLLKLRLPLLTFLIKNRTGHSFAHDNTCGCSSVRLGSTAIPPSNNLLHNLCGFTILFAFGRVATFLCFGNRSIIDYHAVMK